MPAEFSIAALFFDPIDLVLTTTIFYDLEQLLLHMGLTGSSISLSHVILYFKIDAFKDFSCLAFLFGGTRVLSSCYQ